MKQFQFTKIKEFREAIGMSQHDLGIVLSIHPQQISAWERGNGLTVRNLVKLCNALGRKSDEFFTEC